MRSALRAGGGCLDVALWHAENDWCCVSVFVWTPQENPSFPGLLRNEMIISRVLPSFVWRNCIWCGSFRTSPDSAAAIGLQMLDCDSDAVELCLLSLKGSKRNRESVLLPECRRCWGLVVKWNSPTALLKMTIWWGWNTMFLLFSVLCLLLYCNWPVYGYWGSLGQLRLVGSFFNYSFSFSLWN